MHASRLRRTAWILATLVGIGAFTALGAAVYARRSTAPDLLSIAQPVTEVSQWVDPGSCRWLDDHEVMGVQTASPALPEAGTYGGDGRVHTSPFCLDTTRSAVHVIPVDMEPAHMDDGVHMVTYPGQTSASFSPDGRWIFNFMNAHAQQPCLTLVDARAARTVPLALPIMLTMDSAPVWTPDSRYCGLVCDGMSGLGMGGAQLVLVDPNTRAITRSQFYGPGGNSYGGQAALALPTRESLVVAMAGKDQITLSTWGATHATPAPHLDVPLPGGNAAKVDSLALSQDGKRLAWTMTNSHVGILDGLMARLTHRDPSRPTAEMWVCGTDGKNVHCVGIVTMQPSTVGYTDTSLRYVQWLPDDKHVSFVNGSHLYTVLAD